MMRYLFAALALAGALLCVLMSAVAQPAGNASEVALAKRCAPPFGHPRCKRIKRAKPKADHRAYQAMIDAAAIAEGVPVAVARALVKVESGGNPRARDAFGSLGLTQIKCQTARGLGFSGSCAALFDPAINLKWGLRHARLALARGSIGFHQTGLHARRVSRAYVARVHAAMR